MLHIALLVRDVARLADFYREVLSGVEVARHFTESGELRSVWIAIGRVVLMVEHGGEMSAHQAPKPLPEAVEEARETVMGRSGWTVVAFEARGRDLAAWETHFSSHEVRVAYRTASTLYAEDPEHNVFAVTNYPTPIEAQLEAVRKID